MDPALPGTAGLGVHNARRMDRPVEPVVPPPSSQVPISDGDSGNGIGSGSVTGSGTGSDPNSGAGSTESNYSQYATCGDNNGKIYTTEDGKFLYIHQTIHLILPGSTYKLQCSYSGAGRAPIGGSSTQEPTLAACESSFANDTLY